MKGHFSVARSIFPVWALVTLTSTASFNVSAAYVDVVTGSTWRSLTETTGLSWNQLQASCDDFTRLCSGQLTNVDGETVDLDGWTWANLDELSAVVSNITGLDVLQLSRIEEHDSVWAPALIDAFGATEVNVNVDPLRSNLAGRGWVADERDADEGYLPYFVDFAIGDPVEYLDIINMRDDSLKYLAYSSYGVFLHKGGTFPPVSVVPIPASAWLFASAFSLFGYLATRRGR